MAYGLKASSGDPLNHKDIKYIQLIFRFKIKYQFKIKSKEKQLINLVS